MSLSTFLLKKVVPIPKITEYDSYVFIGAHPDDIEVQCGGTIAKLINLGKKITFIIATDGRFGTLDTSIKAEDLVKIRKQESYEAVRELGVSNIIFLNFHDGGRYEVEFVADKIAIELVNIKPDIIFTIDNHVKSETHPDHLKVGRASELALFRCAFPAMMKELGVNEVASPKAIAYYFTDTANSFVNISPYLKQKIEAVSKHKSQFHSKDKGSVSIDMLVRSFKFDGIRYGIKCFAKYAEGFRVLSIDHLHAMPLASKF